MIKKYILSVLIIYACFSTYAQQSEYYLQPIQVYKTALEYFNLKKYAAAQPLFYEYAKEMASENSPVRADAEYYHAICALELFNRDAEYLLSKFIAQYPESPKVRMAYFQMGRFKYRQKEYLEAINWFNKVDKYELNSTDLAEYYFKIGYSYIALGDIEKATNAFYEIKDSDTKYSAPALYYYAHIAYETKKFETALQSFNRLSENEIFSSVVPYYITQIYYLQEKYDKLLDYAPDYVDSASAKRTPEIARLIGESFYRTQMYQEALPYLEKYKEESESFSREDIYQLAYTYYMCGNYEKAVIFFPTVTNIDDQLSQYAYYHLADSYLHLKDKKNAHLAFFSASKLDFNESMKELSMLNYAKLTYELAFSPFNETIKTFEKFIKEFPNSIYIDDAYNYLVEVYLTSKNYKEALISIEKIENKTPQILRAYQRVTYFRGLELINNRNYEKAIKILNKTIQTQAFDTKIAAMAVYWKAESFYKLNKFLQAIENYKQFLVSPGAILLKEYNLTYYNIGYCYFKLKEYKNSQSWFRKYTENATDENPGWLSDAFTRIGDVYFIQREYKLSAQSYGKAVELHESDWDYALFQKAFSEGLASNYDSKISDLKVLLADSVSNYIDDALFEMGKAYVSIDSLKNAVEYFEDLIVKFPNSSYLKKSVLQLALLYYNLDMNQEALALYKRVLTDYPGSQESKDALIGIKNIYVDQNKVDDYFKYLEGLGSVADLRQSEQDSLTYLAAENIYKLDNYLQAINQFEDYANKFPNGSFLLDAYYYKADCYLKLDKTDNAIAELNKIINKPKNLYTDQALIINSELHIEQQEYTEAIEDFALLEKFTESKNNLLKARLGLIRTTYRINAYQQAVDVGKRILGMTKLNNEIYNEASYLMANSYYQLEQYKNALELYRVLAQNVYTKEGAEAKYMVAEILFNQKKLLLAQEEIMSFENTPHQYWLAKSFILLADIFISSNDLFQAKATLESIIQNYENTDDDILSIANKKLSIIQKKEDEKMPGKTTSEMEIDFRDENNVKFKELFDENSATIESKADTSNNDKIIDTEPVSPSDTVKSKIIQAIDSTENK